jgi:hypothetical protein
MHGDAKTMKRRILLALCITVLCSVLVVTLLLYPASQPKTLQDAVTKAIDFFEESREPYALLWLDVMHRQFGIAAFADALQRYDQVLAENPPDAPLLRVFRRIADHDNPLEVGDLQAVDVDVDRITVPALYCDRWGLSADYLEMLEEEVQRGGYLLTHVLLALVWIQENGCGASLSNDFIEDVYHADAALIGDDSVVEDLELEAAAFLYLAGQDALVDDAFIGCVIAAQNDDGGWTRYFDRPSESDWHSTILGLYLLLHVEYPAESYPPMLNPASP